jgi:hypothetical protein
MFLFSIFDGVPSKFQKKNGVANSLPGWISGA